MRKKRLIVAAGIMLMCLGLSFQSYAQGGKIGLRFMPTFTSFDINTPNDEIIKGEFTLGYGFSGLFGYYFSEHVGLQAEVIYNSLNQDYSEADFSGTVKLNYIHIPLLLTLNTGIQKPVNFKVAVGPQIGLNIGSDVSQSGDDTYQALLTVRASDFGIAYGAGLDFGLNEEKTFRLDLGFRGVYGLLDISDNSGTRETDSYYILDKAHINTYSAFIGISYFFD